LKPYYIDRLGTGTTHGSHHEYDRHVPLIWYGSGVTPGRRTERVSVTDLAPTLAGLLQIPNPADANGRRLFAP
jgi:arylsulfatase A-like enzyme